MHCNQAKQVYDRSIEAYLNSPIGGKNYIQDNVLAHFLHFLPHCAKVLDLGCGAGSNANLVMKGAPHAKVTGLDISKAMIQYAQETVPEGTFHCRDIRNVHLPENTYDAVIVASVAFHLKPEEMSGLFKKIAAALKPDGLLFLNYWSGEYSGFKHLDFADRPMMIYYHNDSFFTRLIRSHAFGNLAVKRYPRKLVTAINPEIISDNYFFGQILKNMHASDLLNC